MNLFIGVPVLLLLVLLYYTAITYWTYTISRTLVLRAEVFSRTDEATLPTILVLGDSTGVGVGADSSEDTVAAHLMREVHGRYVENHAVSGAIVKDLEMQLTHAKLKEYTYILIEIGGNDIIRFHSAETESKRLGAFLKTLPVSEKLIVHSSGNVGGSTFFPWFVRPFHTRLNLEFHETFARVVQEHGGTYVNMFTEPNIDPFLLQPLTYFAEDGLHPSSKGYELWFEKIKTAL